jgi:hypothetical protein
MKQEQLDHIAHIFTAAAQGEEIQYRTGPEFMWLIVNPFSNASAVVDTPDQYRIKPKLTSRNWDKPDDVPGPICWMRKPSAPDEMGLINWMDRGGMSVGDTDATGTVVAWRETSQYEYSTDRKTWKPCQVTEEYE